MSYSVPGGKQLVRKLMECWSYNLLILLLCRHRALRTLFNCGTPPKATLHLIGVVLPTEAPQIMKEQLSSMFKMAFTHVNE